jgi:hypothetical protein
VNIIDIQTRIVRLIGRISHEVYYLGDGRQAERADAADTLIREIKAWHARASSAPWDRQAVHSTLVPTFRREATAIRLAYCHALIHATRPLLLGDVNTLRNDPSMQARIDECLSAARETLEIIERIVNDANLFHSFWWTQYVLFCALAVIYVWQIPNRALQGPIFNVPSHEALFELAERCRFHLQSSGSATPPNHRYGLILDELRLEADLDMSSNSILFSGASMLQSWQSTDWLDLDSSVISHQHTLYTGANC